ncbi:MAG: hypothetical protein LBH32_13780, partial [Dysgonamonadaceae bacterium]|nr:hypothetical protein [Dysgonamonadaceae bacterium]
EVKIIHYYDTLQSVQEEGLEQIRRYRDHIDAAAPAYLVILTAVPKLKTKLGKNGLAGNRLMILR